MTPELSREAFEHIERLFLETAQELFEVALALTHGNSVHADDLVQETFVAAAQCRDAKLAGRDASAHRRWLFRVVRNKAIDAWQKDQRVQVRTKADLTDVSGGSVANTDHVALCSAAAARCWVLVEQMPPTRYQVAVLRWGQEWSTAEIAAYLGIAQATVRGHLKLARDELLSEVGADVPIINDAEDERPHLQGRDS
jgi:RNA polymerase sigma-70 factor (ECF subfamily)